MLVIFFAAVVGSSVSFGVAIDSPLGVVTEIEYLSGTSEGSKRDPKSTNSPSQILPFILELSLLPRGTVTLENIGPDSLGGFLLLPPSSKALVSSSTTLLTNESLLLLLLLLLLLSSLLLPLSLLDCKAARTAATIVSVRVLLSTVIVLSLRSPEGAKRPESARLVAGRVRLERLVTLGMLEIVWRLKVIQSCQRSCQCLIKTYRQK